MKPLKRFLRLTTALGGGFVAGWAARSLSDSPEGAGAKLLEIGMNAKKRISHWAAVERERLEDMFAEAQAHGEPPAAKPASVKPQRKGKAVTKRKGRKGKKDRPPAGSEAKPAEGVENDDKA